MSGKHDLPLIGDKSVGELIRLIDETMPEDKPEACVGEDAKLVASYIHEAFYSPAAQVRNQPPRLELARLTVAQYRNAIADIVAAFRGRGEWNAERGLEAEYFKSKSMRDSQRAFSRRDAVVAFQFGDQSPDPAQMPDGQEFSIRWAGSVIAPDTGRYVLVIETDNAFRLWVNDRQRPLIDAWVKSGSDRVFRAEIELLAGRAYPLRLEFLKMKEATASIVLKWRRPQRAEELFANRYLLPQTVPEVFVTQTRFPPDDARDGYVRGVAVSPEWDEAVTNAALEIVDRLGQQMDDLRNADGDGTARARRQREFCLRFAELAFRRPLDDDERDFFVNRWFDSAAEPGAAAKYSLLLVLKSPRFLYQQLGKTTAHGSGAGSSGLEGRVGEPQDSYHVAATLAWALWDSPPDSTLWEVARHDQLQSRAAVAARARRMLADPRAQAKLAGFFAHWLKFDQFSELSKDSQQFPDFNESLASDLRTSLEMFLDDVIWSPSADFRQLLLSDVLYCNGAMARLYGLELPADAPFTAVKRPAAQAAGILTHPYLMSGLAYHASSSPIHRGVFVARGLLGRRLRPPPEAVVPAPPELHADLTTRARVALQTGDHACQTCHRLINPLGFALEEFDAMGRFRQHEHDRPIDASGEYVTRAGGIERFRGARQLAEFLVQQRETHQAFAEQLFQHVVKQPAAAYGADTLTRLTDSFAGHEFNMRELLVEMVCIAAGQGRGDSP